MTRGAWAFFLLFWILSGACADQRPVMVLVAPTRYDIAPGETVTLTVLVRNNLTASPLTLTATASFIDDDGDQQVSTDALDLLVSHPVHVHQVKLAIPDPLEYVPDTAAANGRMLTATADGQSLNVVLDTDIAEQNTVLVTLDVRRP